MPASLPTANDKADFEIRRILQKIYEKHHDDKGRAKVSTPARSTTLAGDDAPFEGRAREGVWAWWRGLARGRPCAV